jgi:hypothetical protein
MPVGRWTWVGCIAMTTACNTIVGNEIGHLGDAAGDGAEPPVGDDDGGDSGIVSSDGGGSGCGVDGAVNEDDGVDAGAGMTCGFTMPNPASAGLPNPASYTEDVAESTITDNVTGLTWARTVEPRQQFTQGQAIRYCEQLGSGWRLPTRLELVSLVDFTVATPGPTINAVFKNTPAQRYWTSSHFVCDPNSVYYVGFDYGSTHPTSPDNAYWVRCVRGAPSRCSPVRYQVQADGSVQDAITGLTWQRNVVKQQAWSEALTFCPTLGVGWRLPSPAELETIVDQTKQSPAIDADAFPGTPIKNSYFWTSWPQAGMSGNAWYVAFMHGHSDIEPVTSLYYVRCVR